MWRARGGCRRRGASTSKSSGGRHVLLVAPCSANTLAKFANGMCDNLLTCVFRAWDFTAETKRVLIAPAMNTAMFESPFTRKHADALAEAGGASVTSRRHAVRVHVIVRMNTARWSRRSRR